MTTEVINMRTGKTEATYSLPPEEAVVAAYRQFELKEYCYWVKREVPDVEVAKSYVFCGHYGAKRTHEPA
jgi:hypothetical protein